MKRILSIALIAVLAASLAVSSAIMPQAASKKTIIKELTAKKWNCYQCVVDGEKKSPYDFYGSVVRDAGAYIKFTKDKTFKCNLGSFGCKGTYAVNTDRVIKLKVIKEWNAKKTYKANKTYKGKISADYKKTAFKMFGAKNYFKK